MAKRPAFQFYPADWRNNLNLRRCSEGARGVWIEILCVLHDSDEYGVARFSLKELAKTAGVSLKNAKELVEKGVLKGDDKNAQSYIYKPRHAGKDGEPVELVKAIEGQPLWYCSRFVRDEYVRFQRGKSTQFQPAPIDPPKPPIGEDLGDGSSSTSSSTSSEEEKKPLSAGKILPPEGLTVAVNPTRPAHAPDWEDVYHHFAAFLKAPDLAKSFFEHHEAKGWVDKMGRAIVFWPADASGYVSNALARQARTSTPRGKVKPKTTYTLTRRDFDTDDEWETYQKKQQSTAA